MEGLIGRFKMRMVVKMFESNDSSKLSGGGTFEQSEDFVNKQL
jgi:hypothetical protein